MSRQIIDESCRNCGEVLFQRAVYDDGRAELVDPSVWPESDGDMKYFRCPACRGKNLVAIVSEPDQPRMYEIVGFIRR